MGVYRQWVIMHYFEFQKGANINGFPCSKCQQHSWTIFFLFKLGMSHYFLHLFNGLLGSCDKNVLCNSILYRECGMVFDNYHEKFI